MLKSDLVSKEDSVLNTTLADAEVFLLTEASDATPMALRFWAILDAFTRKDVPRGSADDRARQEAFAMATRLEEQQGFTRSVYERAKAYRKVLLELADDKFVSENFHRYDREATKKVRRNPVDKIASLLNNPLGMISRKGHVVARDDGKIVWGSVYGPEPVDDPRKLTDAANVTVEDLLKYDFYLAKRFLNVPAGYYVIYRGEVCFKADSDCLMSVETGGWYKPEKEDLVSGGHFCVRGKGNLYRHVGTKNHMVLKRWLPNTISFRGAWVDADVFADLHLSQPTLAEEPAKLEEMADNGCVNIDGLVVEKHTGGMGPYFEVMVDHRKAVAEKEED